MEQPELKNLLHDKLSSALSSSHDYLRREVKVHKAIICSQSPYFHTTCTGGYSEGERGTIKFAAIGDPDVSTAEADEPEIVETMIHFFYHQDYSTEGTGHSMTFHAKIFSVATKYQVEALQKLCASKFTQLLHKVEVDDESTTSDLATAIPIVWTASPDIVTDLREPTTYALLRDRPLVEIESISDAIESVKGLTMALLVENMRRMEFKGKQECNYCADYTPYWWECTRCGSNQPVCYGCTQHEITPTSRIPLACARCGGVKHVKIYPKKEDDEEAEEVAEGEEGSAEE